MGKEFVWDNEKVLEKDSGDDCTIMLRYLIPLKSVHYFKLKK